MTTLLNIAAGFLPLVASDFGDFGVDRVINFDPLVIGKGSDHKVMDSMLSANLKLITLQIPEIEYYWDFDAFDRNVSSASVDLIAAVSPYGFAVINNMTNAMLKNGGYVMLFGNARNKYAKKDDAVESAFHAIYYKVGQVPPDVLGIGRRIRREYSSQCTSMAGTTDINASQALRKVVK